MKKGLIVVALMSLLATEVMATPFLVCMKRLPMRGGGSCRACQIVDTRGMTAPTEDDLCGGLPYRRFYDEDDAIKFMNRNCDCH